MDSLWVALPSNLWVIPFLISTFSALNKGFGSISMFSLLCILKFPLTSKHLTTSHVAKEVLKGNAYVII